MPTDDQFKIICAITVKLAQLGHEVTFTEPITTGPLITTYRFAPRSAAKVAQIVSCSQDLALTLAVEDVVVRRLPGEAVVGVSVPNAQRTLVQWRDTLAAPDASLLLPLNMGVDSEGRLFRSDLTRCPHLLVAGSTDAGKSTFVRCVIASLMFWRSPDEVQFVISDTKRVESGHFIGAPHLLFDPAKTMYETWERMDWLIDETQRRLRVLECWQHLNIASYHKANPYHKMPYIIFVIDELYHILGGEKRGEAKIAGQKLARIVGDARAAGIHVLASTQRPSVDVVSGVAKANFAARLTFRLPCEADSRTVLGHSGAEHLLSRGDMLYLSPNHPATVRLHSAYADTEDIKQCVEFAKQKMTTH